MKRAPEAVLRRACAELDRLAALAVAHDLRALGHVGVVRAAEVADDVCGPVVVQALAGQRRPTALRADVAARGELSETLAEEP